MNDVGFTSVKTGLRSVPLEMTDGTASGQRGLAQRFMVLMLSTTDSGVREFGGGLLRQNVSSTVGEEAIKNKVNIAVANVVSYMKRNESATDSKEERMGSASLSSITLGTDSVSLAFDISALSGNTYSASLQI